MYSVLVSDVDLPALNHELGRSCSPARAGRWLSSIESCRNIPSLTLVVMDDQRLLMS
jgi:hypothetical protein